MSLKWIKGLNVRAETIKHLGKNIVGKPFDIDLSNDFFQIWQQKQRQQNKSEQMGLHQA